MRDPLRKVLKDQDGNVILGAPQAGPGQLAATAAPAANPLGAASAGVNPDAAKMAGTPNQTSAPVVLPQQAPAAPAQPTPVGASLRDVMRHEQAAGATDEQAKKQAEAQRMQRAFGDLGTRVQSLIESHLPGAAPAGGGASPQTPVAATDQPALTAEAAQLTPEQRAAVEAVVSSGGAPAQLAAAKQALGGADPMQYVSHDVAGAVAGQLGAATTDKLLLTPDVVQQLGYQPADLAAQLGIPEAQLGGMNIEQLQSAVQDKIQKEFSEVDRARAQALDPALGPNERAQARAQLKQLGASGVFASEQDMDALSSAVESAEEVEFNGATMKVSELLDDEFLSGLAKEYVDAPADSDIRKQLREKEPALAGWLDKHESALREAGVQLEGAATKFGEVQASNQQAVDGLVSAGIPAEAATDLMKKLIPGWNPGYMTEAVDMSKFPGLDVQAVASAGGDPAVYAQNLTALASVSPDAAAHLARLSPAELKKLGAADRDSPQWRDYMTYTKEWSTLEKIDPSDSAAVTQYLFGAAATPEKVESVWERELAKEQLGESSTWLRQMRGILDSDGDKKIDAPAQVVGNLREALGAGAGLDPTKSASGMQTLGLGRSGPERRDSLASSLASAMSDGKIDGSEIYNTGLHKWSDGDLRTIMQNPALTQDARAEVTSHLQHRDFDGRLRGFGISSEQLNQLASGDMPAGANLDAALDGMLAHVTWANEQAPTSASTAYLNLLHKWRDRVFERRGQAAVAQAANEEQARQAAAEKARYDANTQRIQQSTDSYQNMQPKTVRRGRRGRDQDSSEG